MKKALVSFRVLRRFSKQNNKEIESQIEKFGEKLTELKENEILKKVKNSYKEAYNSILIQNAELAKDVKEKADNVIQVASETFSKVGETIKPLKKPIDQISKTLEPHVQNIKDSEAAKTVSSIAADIDKELKDNSSYYQYGGVSSREKRDLCERELSQSSFPANEKAGSAIVQSESANSEKISNLFKFGFPSKLKLSLPNSNNIFAHLLREGVGNLTDKVKFLFEESDLAKAIRCSRLLKPQFSLEAFTTHSRDYIIPEFVEALIKRDMTKIDKLGSESIVSTIRASFQDCVKNSLKPNGAVLDIRDVEVVSGKVIDNLPVFVVTCSVHQISYVTDSSGLVVQGNADLAYFVNYIFAITIRDSVYKVIEFTARERGI